MIKVSVIVPCYQVEKTLERCLDSLMNQTLKEFEIIAIDDGSTDQTWNILKQYQKKYPEKIQIYQKENGGLGSARNEGLKHIKGEYVGFVDSDDYVELDMFEKLYHATENGKIDLVECDLVWEYPTKNKIDQGIFIKDKNHFIAMGRILVCNKLYKSEIILKNHLEFPVNTRYEDIPFTEIYALYMNTYMHIPFVFYHYVQYATSLSNYQNEKVRDIFHVLEVTMKTYREKANEKELEAIEYFFTRVLLGSSFMRISKVKDNKLRVELIKKTWKTLNQEFPNWKKNLWLKNKSMKNTYYRIMNMPLLRIMSIIFRRK